MTNIRECKTCHRIQPLTTEYFYRAGENTFRGTCRSCILSSRKIDRKENLIKYKDRRKRIYENTREESIKKATKWQGENSSRRRVQRQKWAVTNREQYLKSKRAWSKKNKLRFKIYRSRRRGLERGAVGNYTHEDIQRLFIVQQGACFYCNVVLEKYHVDHKIPLSRGGSNSVDNIVLACPFCNLSKGAKTTEEYISARRELC